MKWQDAVGMVGVALMLGAYIGAQTGKLDHSRAPSLLLNLAGPLLVIFSLLFAFNLPAFITEAAWAAAALFGLARLARKKP